MGIAVSTSSDRSSGPMIALRSTTGRTHSLRSTNPTVLSFGPQVNERRALHSCGMWFILSKPNVGNVVSIARSPCEEHFASPAGRSLHRSKGRLHEGSTVDHAQFGASGRSTAIGSVRHPVIRTGIAPNSPGSVSSPTPPRTSTITVSPGCTPERSRVTWYGPATPKLPPIVVS